MDKNKKTKLNIAAEFESLLFSVNSSVTDDNKEEFHHFLRCSTNCFAQNISHTQDYTWKTLYNLSSNPDIAVLQGDKDSTVVILRRDVYSAKIHAMIEEGLMNGKYVETTDNTISDLQNFLYRNFRKNSHSQNILPYDKFRPSSNQPAFLFATAKTHKFDDFSEKTSDNLKLRPIVSTVGTFYYQTAKHLASYLAPLTDNELSIKNTLDFAQRLDTRSLNDNKVLVSYDVTSLFTQIPLEEIIDYILDQIYVQNKLPAIACKLIFKRLLYKVTQGTCLVSMGHFIDKWMAVVWGIPYPLF